MRSRIVKWGNSLGLRIPKAFAEEVAVGEGSVVEISLVEGDLVIRPAPVRYELQELLEGVTQTNVHDEVATGEPRGRESW